MAGDKQVGTLGSTAKGRGLALAAARPRRRRASPPARRSPPAASPVRLVKPDWATLRLAGRDQAARHEHGRRCIADGLARCPWPKEDPLYVAYHDEEWGVPEFDDRALYEKLVLDGFQAGLSWITILRKRENFRRAFDDFEPGENRALHAEEDRAADAGRRHRAQPRQDRGRRAARRAPISTIMEKGRAFRRCCGISSTASRSINAFRRHQAGAGGNRHLAQDVEGTGRRAASSSSARLSSMPSCRRSAWSTTIW